MEERGRKERGREGEKGSVLGRNKKRGQTRYCRRVDDED